MSQWLGPLQSWLGKSGKSRTKPSASSAHSSLPAREPTSEVRSSTALQEFFEAIRDQLGLTIVDFSGACQENVSFITGLQHRLYAESMPRTVEAIFGPPEDVANYRSPERIHDFLRSCLSFEPQSVDAILLWDSLEWLEPEAQRAVANRIAEVLRPNGLAFAIFHTESAVPAVPVHYFRLQDPKTLIVTDTGRDRPHRHFTNRNVEKLFEQFDSLKFFLSRDSLREVIIRR